jgi:glyoxalase family protein
MQLTGIHHVTAITAHASQNIQFYTQLLGLRLVKKTVNQDDVSAYHLFYADALGSPGTDVTFFDWPFTAPNQVGAGSIAEIALRVPGINSLQWWAQRLTSAGVSHSGLLHKDGQDRIEFTDPEGQRLALVNDDGIPGGQPWENSPVPVDQGLTGIYGVTLMVADLGPTAHILTDVLGFRQTAIDEDYTAPGHQRVVFETGPGGPGSQVWVEAGPSLMPARLGRGGVHHVAFRTPDDDQQQEWRQRIAASGLQVTPIIDRFYFKSIYFREPGGILFEIATDGPGFTADEDLEDLGESLALPPFLEPHRREIEANLRPIV